MGSYSAGSILVALGIGASAWSPADVTTGAPHTPPVGDSVLVQRFQSRVLAQERELIIHLPRGYAASRKYPVLYVLDGTSQDQPLADKLDSLQAAGLVPPTIVVGIPNMTGSNRTYQLIPPFMGIDPDDRESPKGTADRFLEFMETELIPRIAKSLGASETRLFAGNSRGGILVMYSLIRKPDLFAGRLCFSTPLWRENNVLVERVAEFLATRRSMRSFLYLSVGENETDNMKRGLDALAAVLEKSAPVGFVWRAERTPGGDHQGNAAVSGWSALRKWGAFVGP